MANTKQKQAAEEFAKRWAGRGQEDQDDQKYWNEILQGIFGVDDPDYIDYQKRVKVDGNTKRIDGYIASTKVLIEQKSIDIPLNRQISHGDKKFTAFEQAKMYVNNLPHNEHPRWIVTSNFAEIWVYDLNKPGEAPEIIKLEDFGKDYTRLGFLVDENDENTSKELEVSVKAGELVGVIYDALHKNYVDPDNEESLKSLNILCVRLVFCLYAEDALIFGRPNMFHDYLSQFSNPNDFRKALIELFKILNQKPEERDPYGDPTLLAFPYVNGGLFAKEEIEIPRFTPEIMDILLSQASKDFDWSDISPTIFGAVFESTLNPETRRQGGMHYTSIENIHKVIDPLFLDDLKDELDTIKKEPVDNTRKKKLREYQDKLASLTFLDPACGSGNFLTETYVSLRRLENEVLQEIASSQISMVFDEAKNPVKVSIEQFYGIEINDFATDVAKTALWIAESQMLAATEHIVHQEIDFLPLTTNASIVEGNALRIDWNDICPVNELNYIMGNPPFIGARLMAAEQKDDVLNTFGKKWNNVGNLDYVSCWYKKCVDYIQNTFIRAAFVSTNSITQGEQVAILWKPLFEENGVHFDFAHKTFVWDSEANQKAHVHCVIIGFSVAENNKPKTIFEKNNKKIVSNINGYLIDSDNVFVTSSKTPLCKGVPEARSGNKPIDGGSYLFTQEEYEDFIKLEPASKHWFKRWYGAEEFINNKVRYCLWLGDCPPSELRKMPHCMERIQAVRDFRLSSKSAGTVKIADKPTRFHVETMPQSDYLIMPLTSSERRRYVPIGFMTPDSLASNLVTVVMDATIYDFGILMSNVFMSWMRSVGGRLKSDYRITKDNLYNTFPWPTPTDSQKAKIKASAQGILDARVKFPETSLADLYDELTMPIELRRAHQVNDKAVMEAYGFSTKMTEPECVAELMKMYQKLVENK